MAVTSYSLDIYPPKGPMNLFTKLLSIDQNATVVSDGFQVILNGDGTCLQMEFDAIPSLAPQIKQSVRAKLIVDETAFFSGYCITSWHESDTLVRKFIFKPLSDLLDSVVVEEGEGKSNTATLALQEYAVKLTEYMPINNFYISPFGDLKIPPGQILTAGQIFKDAIKAAPSNAYGEKYYLGNLPSGELIVAKTSIYSIVKAFYGVNFDSEGYMLDFSDDIVTKVYAKFTTGIPKGSQTAEFKNTLSVVTPLLPSPTMYVEIDEENDYYGRHKVIDYASYPYLAIRPNPKIYSISQPTLTEFSPMTGTTFTDKENSIDGSESSYSVFEMNPYDSLPHTDGFSIRKDKADRPILGVRLRYSVSSPPQKITIKVRHHRVFSAPNLDGSFNIVSLPTSEITIKCPTSIGKIHDFVVPTPIDVRLSDVHQFPETFSCIAEISIDGNHGTSPLLSTIQVYDVSFVTASNEAVEFAKSNIQKPFPISGKAIWQNEIIPPKQHLELDIPNSTTSIITPVRQWTYTLKTDKINTVANFGEGSDAPATKMMVRRISKEDSNITSTITRIYDIKSSIGIEVE